MVKKTRPVIGDCSLLPYSRLRATNINLPKAGMTPQVPALEGAGSALRLRKLPGKPTLDWPICLPKTDPRGLATGRSFECWKKARDGKTGISGHWFSIKGGRMQHCHSALEAKLRAYFDMCPFVVECRTQYPSWNREEYEAYYLANKPFPANKVLTIDFMLTLSIPGLPFPLYHGVSGKPMVQHLDERTVARHAREADALWKWGGTHEVMDEYTVSDIEYSNYLLLKSWFLWTDIESHMRPALALAIALQASKAKGSLDRVLPMVGRRLGYSRDMAYSLFGIATFLGYLWIDHTFPLRPSESLALLP